MVLVSPAVQLVPGAIVGPATDAAGLVIDRALPTTNTAIVPIVGLALSAADTNSALSVLLHSTLYSELA